MKFKINPSEESLKTGGESRRVIGYRNHREMDGDRGNDSMDLKKDQRPERGLFILLLLLTCVFLVGLAVLLWWVPYVGFTGIHPKLPVIMAVVLGAVVLFLLGGALTLVFTILRGKNLFFNRRIRGVVIRFLFPMLVLIGKFIGVGKDQVRRAFVAINNQLVLAEARVVRPEKLLLLLPHCLQFHECTVRITGNVSNCKRCGKCKIKNLVQLSELYHVNISVATGGTLARRIVKETRPDLIIGVACERDLTSGIQDAHPIPVFGIFNRRPNGPCYDTDVDIELVEKGICTFLGYEKRHSEKFSPVGVEGRRKQEGRLLGPSPR